ncbi:hypothetical protein BKA81DRAFT_147259 [Phyllosticta paracitricarpa]
MKLSTRTAFTNFDPVYRTTPDDACPSYSRQLLRLVLLARRVVQWRTSPAFSDLCRSQFSPVRCPHDSPSFHATAPPWSSFGHHPSFYGCRCVLTDIPLRSMCAGHLLLFPTASGAAPDFCLHACRSALDASCALPRCFLLHHADEVQTELEASSVRLVFAVVLRSGNDPGLSQLLYLRVLCQNLHTHY